MFASNSRLRASKTKGDSTVELRRDVTPKSFQRQQNLKSGSFLFTSGNKTPMTGEKPKISESYSRFDTKLQLQRPLTTKNVDSNRLAFGNRFLDDKKRMSNYSSSRGDSPSVNRSAAVVAPRSKSRSPRRVEDDIVREQIMIVPKKYNIGSRQIRHSKNNHPAIPKVMQQLPNYEPAKHSNKANGLVRSYAACTNQGPVRQYNQDRVSIILNIAKPQHCTDWKKAAYFGVFDGHGGVDCADFLRDSLHTFLVKDKNFPNNIPEALSQSFYRCQTTFLQRCKSMTTVDKSGSCCLIVFIYGDTCYVANSGDSRAVMSSFSGERVSELSIDHKPSDEYEQKRIIEAGGRIYQTKLQNADPSQLILYEGQELPFIMGPHRVLPGRLSVTRTFGDIEAKLPEFGGNPRAIIATPQIRSFKLSKDNDFIILGCDGIFDKLTNEEIIECVWETAKDRTKYTNIHDFCGLASENIMRLSVHKKTLDNITIVMLGLEGLQNALFPDGAIVTAPKPVELKIEAEKISKPPSPKGSRSSTHFQNESKFRPNAYERKIQDRSVSRSQKKPDSAISQSLLDAKSRLKDQSTLRSMSPSSANNYRSFSYYRT